MGWTSSPPLANTREVKREMNEKIRTSLAITAVTVVCLAVPVSGVCAIASSGSGSQPIETSDTASHKASTDKTAPKNNAKNDTAKTSKDSNGKAANEESVVAAVAGDAVASNSGNSGNAVVNGATNNNNATSNPTSGSNNNRGSGSSGSGDNGGSTPAPSPAPEPAPSDPHAGQTWHEAVYETRVIPAVYENQWVSNMVTVPDYQTVYGYKCHDCGLTTTDWQTIDDHCFNYHSGGYTTSEWQEQVGSHQEDQGSYQSVLVSPERTEQVLVREAGWY